MDLHGLTSNITVAAFHIDTGRKGFAIKGKADEGRVSYEKGISLAFSTFRDAQSTVDPRAIILIEYTFLIQELQFCDATDTDTLSSLTEAKQNFDDAFLVLEIVEDKTLYHAADKAFPNNKKHRIKGFPKDSFHIACNSHKARLKNIKRSPGIDLIEKALLQQRLINLSTAQAGYIALQKKAMEFKAY